MDRIRRQIIQYFVIFALVIAVLESIVDSIYDDWIFIHIEAGSVEMAFIMVSYVLVSALIFLIFSIWFARIIDKIMKKEAHRQVNERNMLYANITHDLKTPITSILGFSRALLDQKVEETQKEEAIHTIYQKAKRTDELINGLFRYSKLTTDECTLNLQICDLCSMVRDVAAFHYEVFEAKKMELEIRIPEEKWRIQVDYEELTRAITNLVVNAVNHNPKGTNTMIEVRKEEEWYQIIVADTGESIPSDLSDKIFEPFICGNESRTEGKGSGLGLAITRQIVKKHGGSLSLKEPFEEFTKAFIMLLPKDCL